MATIPIRKRDFFKMKSYNTGRTSSPVVIKDPGSDNAWIKQTDRVAACAVRVPGANLTPGVWKLDKPKHRRKDVEVSDEPAHKDEVKRQYNHLFPDSTGTVLVALHLESLKNALESISTDGKVCLILSKEKDRNGSPDIVGLVGDQGIGVIKTRFTDEEAVNYEVMKAQYQEAVASFASAEEDVKTLTAWLSTS